MKKFSEFLLEFSDYEIERKRFSKIPKEGNYPALKTYDGDIYVDTTPNTTHILFAKRLGLTPDDVSYGGWMVDGEFSESMTTSYDIKRWKENHDAKKNVAKRMKAHGSSDEEIKAYLNNGD